MPDLGQVLVSDTVESAMIPSRIQNLLEELVGFADQRELATGRIYHRGFSIDSSDFMAIIKNNPLTDEYDVWIGEAGGHCPWLDEPPTSNQADDDEADDDEADDESETDSDEGDDGVPPDEWESEVAEVMRKTIGDAVGVAPANIKLRLERTPPFRLQLIQGGKVTNEIPLWSLSVINALKSICNFHPFCYDKSHNHPGGIYSVREEQWVQWSSDENDRPAGSKVVHA